MISADDFKKLVDTFVTKFEFKEEIEKLVTKEDNERVLRLVDTVLGELKTMRQEQAAHFQQHEDTKAELKNHETRIKKLESPSAAA